MPVSSEKGYDHQKIESKWRKVWEKSKLFQGQYLQEQELDEVNSENQRPRSEDRDLPFSHENKCYILPQLPYPSGSGLHMGHSEGYVACDMYARYKRMTGKKVLQAIGWDAFGLPAENYAIKTNVHPRINTDN